jgi:hypothetical protein
LNGDTERVLSALHDYYKNRLNEDRCFEWDDGTEEILSKHGVKDPPGFLNDLVNTNVLEEPILGWLRFPGSFYTIKDEKEKSEMVEERSMKEETVQDEPVQGEDNNTNRQSCLTKASDIIQSSKGFGYPLIQEYLDNGETRTGIMSDARLVNGKYGESALVCIDQEWYRTGSKVFLEHVKALVQDDKFPYEVTVKQLKGKTGRTYYSL